jgi:hypothetical protein
MNLVGICMGIPITCNDGNILTTDSCNTATGCVYTPVSPNSCDDGNACTINDVNVMFIGCQGSPITCNDQDESTTDTCNPTAGCVFTPQTPLVPEFGTFMILLTALGAVGIFFIVRRK